MKKKNNKLVLITYLAMFLFVSGCGNNSETVKEEINKEETSEETVVTEEATDESEYQYTAELKDLWLSNYAINNDYLGQIYFESGLIDQRVTHCTDNSYYLRRNFETGEYDIYGTVFEDHNCYYNSQNTIIYGHYVSLSYDPNAETIMFTPLAKLLDEKNYKDNRIVYLLLENELRVYEVVSVFYCDLYKDGDNWYPNPDLIYYYPEYDEAYFEKYKASVLEVEEYDTGADFNYSDRFLTLQTCVEQRDDLREIVLCRQINTAYYE